MMETNQWLFGTIREIKDYEDSGIFAAVAEDTDDDHALCIEFRATNGQYSKYGSPVFSAHFNINWLEKDERHVDWLAGVVGRMIRDAYRKGVNDENERIYEKLRGLKSLLAEVE